MTLLKKHERIAVALFFLLLTVIGLWTIPDYTGSYDETVLWNTFRVNMHEYALLLEKMGIRWETGLALDVESITVHSDRDHGLAPFYICAPFLAQMNETFKFSSTIWCIVTLIWFLLGVLAMYGIARELDMPVALACAAALMLYLSPRMFAEGHFSDRDVVLLCITLLCLWTGLRFLKTLTIGRGICFSIVGALATNIRIPGILAWGLIGAWAVCKLTLYREWNRQKVGVAIGTILTFALVYIVLTPAFWVDPAAYFNYLFSDLTDYGWKESFYFRNALFKMPENPLPWYYLPYMMLVTLPLYTFPLCAVGQLHALAEAVRRPKQFLADSKGQFLLVSTLAWLLPVVAFAVTRPVVYNGWRHLYFCYAGVLAMMIYGLKVIWDQCSVKVWLRRLFAGAVCVIFAVYGVGIVINHPNQSSYYNLLANKGTMETDYWNSSGAGALKRLAESKERNQDLPLEVGCWFFNIQNARFKLSDELQSRLTTTTEPDAPYLYYIENYVQVYNVPDPEGYHVLFEVESYGRLIGTMYERDT